MTQGSGILHSVRTAIRSFGYQITQYRVQDYAPRLWILIKFRVLRLVLRFCLLASWAGRGGAVSMRFAIEDVETTQQEETEMREDAYEMHRQLLAKELAQAEAHYLSLITQVPPDRVEIRDAAFAIRVATARYERWVVQAGSRR